MSSSSFEPPLPDQEPAPAKDNRTETAPFPARPPRIRFTGKVLTAERGGLKVPTEARQLCAIFSNGMWLVREGHGEHPLVLHIAEMAAERGIRLDAPRYVTPEVFQQVANYARKVNPRLSQWVNYAVYALFASTLLGFAGRILWVFDLIGYLKLYWAVLAIPFIVAGVLARQSIVALMAMLCLVLNLFGVYMAIPQAPPLQVTSDMPSGELRLFSVNVTGAAASKAEIATWLKQNQPDIVYLVGTERNWQAVADELINILPFSRMVESATEYGALLLSRYPLEQVSIGMAGPGRLPLLMVQIETPIGRVAVIGAHAPQATSNMAAFARNIYLSQISAMANTSHLPTFIMGTLNAPPWSSAFDSLRGLPLLAPSSLVFPATWPKWAGPAGLPLDQIMLTIPYDHPVPVKFAGVVAGPSFAGASRASLIAVARVSP